MIVKGSSTADGHKVEEPRRLRRLSPGYLAAKRAFDIVIGSLLILLFLPVMAVAGLVILLQDGWPIHFVQRRIARGGGTFRMLKLRSMVRNAEEALRSNPALMEEYVKNFKLERDPRLLKCGAFLRRTSIDELPQFFNVVGGSMSLVGPRPVTPDELPKFEGEFDWYLQLKPGIAGVWQSSGRNEVGYPGVIEFDREYYEKASFWFDLKVLWKTTLAVLKMTGAR